MFFQQDNKVSTQEAQTMEETADNHNSDSSQSELENDSSELPEIRTDASISTCNCQCSLSSIRTFNDPTFNAP